MNKARLFELRDSNGLTMGLYQSTNWSIDDERSVDLIRVNWSNESELNYFGIYSIGTTVIKLKKPI